MTHCRHKSPRIVASGIHPASIIPALVIGAFIIFQKFSGSPMMVNLIIFADLIFEINNRNCVQGWPVLAEEHINGMCLVSEEP